MHEVRLLRTAEGDLTEIVTFIAADRLEAAELLMDRFEKKLSLLADNPHMGAVPSEKMFAMRGYRYLVLDNYLVFYMVEEEVVIVHRIIHGARDYKII